MNSWFGERLPTWRFGGHCLIGWRVKAEDCEDAENDLILGWEFFRRVQYSRIDTMMMVTGKAHTMCNSAEDFSSLFKPPRNSLIILIVEEASSNPQITSARGSVLMLTPRKYGESVRFYPYLPLIKSSRDIYPTSPFTHEDWQFKPLRSNSSSTNTRQGGRWVSRNKSIKESNLVTHFLVHHVQCWQTHLD